MKKMVMFVMILLSMNIYAEDEFLNTIVEHKTFYDTDNKIRGAENNLYLTLDLPVEGVEIAGQVETLKENLLIGFYHEQAKVALLYQVIDFVSVGLGPKYDRGIDKYKGSMSAYIIPAFEIGNFALSFENEFNFLGDNFLYYNDLVIDLGFESISLNLTDENEYTYIDNSSALTNTLTIDKLLYVNSGFSTNLIFENEFGYVSIGEDEGTADIVKAGIGVAYKSVQVVGYYSPVVHPEVVQGISVDFIVDITE